MSKLKTEEAHFLKRVRKHDDENLERVALDSERAIILGFRLEKRGLLNSYFDGCRNTDVVYLSDAGRAELKEWEVSK